MFIIFGWGKVTTKAHGWTEPEYCEYCRNTPRHALVEKRVWFTLFFIPVIPYEHKHLCLCPICQSGYEYPKDVFRELVSRTNGSSLAVKESPMQTQASIESASPPLDSHSDQLSLPAIDSEQATALPSVEQALWRCRCGNVNSPSTATCLKCGRSPQAII